MMSALTMPPLMVTEGTNGISSRMTTAWNSSVRMTSATTDRLATSASRTGRMSRFTAEMNSTATVAPPSSLISSWGSSQAVMWKAMTPATSATMARLMSAVRPSRQCHRSSNCVR